MFDGTSDASVRRQQAELAKLREESAALQISSQAHCGFVVDDALCPDCLERTEAVAVLSAEIHALVAHMRTAGICSCPWQRSCDGCVGCAPRELTHCPICNAPMDEQEIAEGECRSCTQAWTEMQR